MSVFGRVKAGCVDRDFWGREALWRVVCVLSMLFESLQKLKTAQTDSMCIVKVSAVGNRSCRANYGQYLSYLIAPGKEIGAAVCCNASLCLEGKEGTSIWMSDAPIHGLLEVAEQVSLPRLGVHGRNSSMLTCIFSWLGNAITIFSSIPQTRSWGKTRV